MGHETSSLSLVYSACVKLNTERIRFQKLCVIKLMVVSSWWSLIYVSFNYFHSSSSTDFGNRANGQITK